MASAVVSPGLTTRRLPPYDEKGLNGGRNSRRGSEWETGDRNGETEEAVKGKKDEGKKKKGRSKSVENRGEDVKGRSENEQSVH